jgi:hypothetical protein
MDLPVISSLEKLPYVLRGLRPIRGSTAEMTQADAVDIRFVMADRRGLEVDLHGVVFDAADYPAASFTGSGRIGGEPARCMTAEYQVANHATYDPGEADLHDLRALHQALGLALPDEYARNG